MIKAINLIILHLWWLTAVHSREARTNIRRVPDRRVIYRRLPEGSTGGDGSPGVWSKDRHQDTPSMEKLREYLGYCRYRFHSGWFRLRIRRFICVRARHLHRIPARNSSRLRQRRVGIWLQIGPLPHFLTFRQRIQIHKSQRSSPVW